MKVGDVPEEAGWGKIKDALTAVLQEKVKGIALRDSNHILLRDCETESQIRDCTECVSCVYTLSGSHECDES